jgi:WD40 repeat protein
MANWKAHQGLALPVYSPDGKVLAVGGGNGELIFYDARSHTRLKEWAAHERRIYNMAFSPDGKWLVTGSMDQTASVWDVQRRMPVRTFREHRATVGAIAFDPNGRDVLTAAGDNRLLRWNLFTGVVQGEFRGHRVDVSAIAASPDGTHLLSGDWGGAVKAWDWTTDDVRTFRVTTDWLVPTIYDAAWDPQEERLTCGSTDVVTHIWNRNGTEVGEFRSDDPCRAVAYSRDGSLLFAGDDTGRLLIFGKEPAPSRTLHIHQGPILALALDPTGRILATASADSSLKLFTVPELELMREIREHEGAVQDVQFSPNGKVLASCGVDGTIRSWSVSTGQSLAVARAGDSSVNDIGFDAAGKRLVSVSSSGEVRIWNEQLHPLASFDSSHSKVNAVAWSQSESRIATEAPMQSCASTMRRAGVKSRACTVTFPRSRRFNSGARTRS